MAKVEDTFPCVYRLTKICNARKMLIEPNIEKWTRSENSNVDPLKQIGEVMGKMINMQKTALAQFCMLCPIRLKALK